jgi:hypothetical protein
MDSSAKYVCPSSFCRGRGHELDHIPYSNEYECAYCGNRYPAKQIQKEQS